MIQNRKRGNRNPFSNQPFMIISILIALSLTLQMTGVAFAEGSRNLYPTGANGSRGDLEWRTSTYGPAGTAILRRTLLRVYAQTGEYILMGSSAVGIGSGDIYVYNPGLVTGNPGQESLPGLPSYSCDASRSGTQGQITSRVQELAGPQAISAGGNPSGYVPCYYQAPSAGIYDVVIFGPSGFSSNTETSPTGLVIPAGPNFFNADQSTNVAAWDVTVRSSVTSSTTDITGRLFTYYLAQITGGNARPLYSSLYVVTLDGFIYRADLNAMDPFGFLFYGNSVGFYNSDGMTPLYHDVLSIASLPVQSQNQLEGLQGGVFTAPPKFPIFFNPPDTAVLTALGIPTTASVPLLSTFHFTGTAGGSQSYYGTGGSFSFISNTSGYFDIVISRDGVNFDPTLSSNRTIHAMGVVGSNTISWDGKDNNGAAFPVGSYQVHTTIHAGELHMALIDVENSVSGGPSYTLLNPPGGTCPFSTCSAAFYDDRGYTTMSGVTVGTVGTVLCGTNPPSVSSAVLNPFDSTTTQRAFGLSDGSGNSATAVCASDASFGDKKGLDLWTYFPSQAVLTIIVIVNAPPQCGPNSTDPACNTSVVPVALPSTGFAPNVLTSLPQQPSNKAYSAMGDLWLEIPSQNVRQNIIGVPNSTNSWDVSWLGENIGYLAGTAFPTWAGNSVLVGHVYDANGKPGPFINIGKLSWGQQIIIHAWGEKYIYEVRTVNNWILPTDTRLINKHEEYPWITLITCRSYDEATNSYKYRTITRAVLTKVVADNNLTNTKH